MLAYRHSRLLRRHVPIYSRWLQYMWTCEFRTTVYNLISSWKWLSNCNRFGLFIRGTDRTFWAKNRSRKSRNTVSIIETYLHTGVMFPCPQWPYHRMQGGGRVKGGGGEGGGGNEWQNVKGSYIYSQANRPQTLCSSKQTGMLHLQGSLYIRERPTGHHLY